MPFGQSPEQRSPSKIDVTLVYEDANGTRTTNPAPLFLWAKYLLPFFAIDVDAARLKPELFSNELSLEFIFSSSPLPNASIRSLPRRASQIRFNIGLYQALLALPAMVRFIRSFMPGGSIDLDRLATLQASAECVDELVQLMMHWGLAARSGWKELSPAASFTIPDPRFALPTLFFVMAHEFAHYSHAVILNENLTQEILARADMVLDSMFKDRDYLRLNSMTEIADPVGVMLSRNPKMRAAWKYEIAADQWAFLSCRSRFGSSYDGPRIPPTGDAATDAILGEPQFTSEGEGMAYVDVATETVFGTAKFLETFLNVCLGQEVSLETHPTAFWRKHLFAYGRGDNQPARTRFYTSYGAGWLTQAVMDSMAAQFVQRMERAAPIAEAFSAPNIPENWRGIGHLAFERGKQAEAAADLFGAERAYEQAHTMTAIMGDHANMVNSAGRLAQLLERRRPSDALIWAIRAYVVSAPDMATARSGHVPMVEVMLARMTARLGPDALEAGWLACMSTPPPPKLREKLVSLARLMIL